MWPRDPPSTWCGPGCSGGAGNATAAPPGAPAGNRGGPGPFRGTISLPLEDALRGTGALDLDTVPPDDVTRLGLADALTTSTEVTAVLRADREVPLEHLALDHDSA
jgi:hypothetical protein